MITAYFENGQDISVTDGLFQWDIGQQLKIVGLSGLTENTEVHFANNKMTQAIVKTGNVVNDDLTVDIPNEFLQYGGAVKGKAWLYHRTASTEALTIKTIEIPVTARKRPNEYVSPSDPDSRGIVERALEILDDYETDLAQKLDDDDDVIETRHIIAGAVKEINIDSGAVTTNKIQNESVTENKLSTALNNIICKIDNAVYDEETLSYANSKANTIYTTVNARVRVYTGGYDTVTTGIVIPLSCSGSANSGGVPMGQILITNDGLFAYRTRIGNQNAWGDFVELFCADNIQKISNKITSFDNDEYVTHNTYPTSKAVSSLVSGTSSSLQSMLSSKESASNKVAETINRRSPSQTLYPSEAAVVAYGEYIYDTLYSRIGEMINSLDSINAQIAAIKEFVGYPED